MKLILLHLCLLYLKISTAGDISYFEFDYSNHSWASHFINKNEDENFVALLKNGDNIGDDKSILGNETKTKWGSGQLFLAAQTIALKIKEIIETSTHIEIIDILYFAM